MSQRNEKFLLALLLFLGLLLPLRSAHAQLQALANLIIFGLPAVIIQVILALSNVVVSLASMILSWVLSENFIAWSYTDPARNPIIDVGWTLTRDLMNMCFVIVLAFIGLATALKLKEYELQKTLPLLLIIALVINFTPVICGVFVDASNIVMNFFLEKLTGMTLLEQQFAAQGAIIQGMIKNIGTNIIEMAGRCLQGVVMAVFNILAALVFLLFAMLFAARYIAIWLLVILSPVAFFSYILPTTRSFWNRWWKWFTQWCMVGVTGAFFIYLANHMLVHAPEMIEVPPPTSGTLASFWIGFLNTLLPYILALGFMIIGFLQSVTSSAVGATMITSAVRGVSTKGTTMMKKKGTAWLKEKGWEATRAPLKSEKVRRMATQMATARPWGAEQKGVAGVLKRGITRPFVTIGRTIGKAGPAMTEIQLQEISKAEGQTKGKTAETNVQEIRFGGTKAKKIGALLGAVSENQVEDLRDLGLTNQEIVDLGKAAAKIHPDQRDRLAKFFPLLAEQMGVKLKDKDLAAGYTSVAEKLVATAKPSTIEKWDEETLTDPITQEAIRKFWSGRELGAAARQFGKLFVDEFVKGVQAHPEQVNQKIQNYLGRTPAYELGFGRFPGAPAPGVPTTPAAAVPVFPLNQELENLNGEMASIESTPRWDKSPAQVKRWKEIRKRIKTIQKEQKRQKNQEIEITKLYNKIPYVPDEEYRKAFAFEEILGSSKLPRKFNVDESKRNQPGPVIEIGKETVNVHPDFLDEVGQIFDESKSEQERKQILGNLVGRVQSEKQKQLREKRRAQITQIKSAPRRIGDLLRKSPQKGVPTDETAEIIRQLDEIVARAEELAKLPPEELEQYEAEIEELERRREEIEKQLGG